MISIWDLHSGQIEINELLNDKVTEILGVEWTGCIHFHYEIPVVTIFHGDDYKEGKTIWFNLELDGPVIKENSYQYLIEPMGKIIKEVFYKDNANEER